MRLFNTKTGVIHNLFTIILVKIIAEVPEVCKENIVPQHNFIKKSFFGARRITIKLIC